MLEQQNQIRDMEEVNVINSEKEDPNDKTISNHFFVAREVILSNASDR